MRISFPGRELSGLGVEERAGINATFGEISKSDEELSKGPRRIERAPQHGCPTSVHAGTNLALSTIRKVITIGNVCSILGEGVLVMYLLSPLSTIRANDHAQEDIPPRYRSEPRRVRYNWG